MNCYDTELHTYLVKSVSSVSVGRGSIDGFMDLGGLSVDFYVSGVLVVGSRFICLDLGTESMGISNVVDLSGDTMGIDVSVASLYVSVSVSGFLSGLLEFSVITSDVVVVLVWDGSLKNEKLNSLNNCIAYIFFMYVNRTYLENLGLWA